MSVAVSDLRPVGVPDGVEIRPVTTEADAVALVAVDVEAFGGDPEIGAAFFGAGARGVDGVHAFVAWEKEEPVAIAVGYEHDGAVGVMGVAVVPRARRRGIGSAVTACAVRSFPDADLAWLHPTPEARTMYEDLGFRRIADHEVWVRHPAVDAPT